MKYTTINQGEKLAELIKGDLKNDGVYVDGNVKWLKDDDAAAGIPCWSVSSLINQIDKDMTIHIGTDGKTTITLNETYRIYDGQSIIEALYKVAQHAK